MAPVFDYYEREEPKHQHWVGTQGSCKCFYEIRKVASSTMPLHTGSYSYFSDQQKPLTERQRQNLWLFEKRQQEIKRYWKKDQYAKVRGQIRL